MVGDQRLCSPGAPWRWQMKGCTPEQLGKLEEAGSVLLFWVLQKRDTHLVISGLSTGTSGFPEQSFIFQRLILMLIAHDCLSTTKLPSVLRKGFPELFSFHLAQPFPALTYLQTSFHCGFESQTRSSREAPVESPGVVCTCFNASGFQQTNLAAEMVHELHSWGWQGSRQLELR